MKLHLNQKIFFFDLDYSNNVEEIFFAIENSQSPIMVNKDKKSLMFFVIDNNISKEERELGKGIYKVKVETLIHPEMKNFMK